LPSTQHCKIACCCCSIGPVTPEFALGIVAGLVIEEEEVLVVADVLVLLLELDAIIVVVVLLVLTLG
jgi:hypothetical protein